MSVCLPPIVNLMALFLPEKQTLTRKKILYSSYIHAKLSLLGWKIGHFTDLFHYQRHRLQSHSPQFTQFFYAIGLPNTIPNTISRIHGTKNRIYRTSKVNKADTMFDLTFDPAGVEFLGTISKFRERNKISPLLVYVVDKTRN